LEFGQGRTAPVGASYSLDNVPGVYEGRPERYFDGNCMRLNPHQESSQQQQTKVLSGPAIVGASYSMENVPGMYEGRPERYFDSANDPRQPKLPPHQETSQQQQTKVPSGPAVVGASYSMENVPGMYEGRPERYFDSANDPRQPNFPHQESPMQRKIKPTDQINLLDLDFLDTTANPVLPDVQYLPAIQRQQDLEKQIREQQVKPLLIFKIYSLLQTEY